VKNLTILLLFTACAARAAELPPARIFESSLQSRIGFDSNPIGSDGTSAKVLGDDSSLTFSAGVNLSLALSAATPAKPTLNLAYSGETTRFDRWSGENFSTHRLALGGQFAAGNWKFTADGSSLFVDGSRDTLISVPTINANALPLWRERRQQWQHRLKLQTQADFGPWVVRGTATMLAYDYETKVVPGHVAFANRADYQAGLDLGWRQNPDSLWLVGVREGHQTQATVPLPNCEFEYSNRYDRLAVGWEGKPWANTTVTLAAGPDFRYYSGAIDPRVFFGGRNRRSLWFEGGFTAKPTPKLTLTGKVARMDWLSSTGKSAYIDSSAETAANIALTGAWTMRVTAKVHRCDYFPTIRDDWESLLGLGATLKLSPRASVSFDVLRHHAWNNLSALPERTFQRFAGSVGVTVKL